MRDSKAIRRSIERTKRSSTRCGSAYCDGSRKARPARRSIEAFRPRTAAAHLQHVVVTAERAVLSTLVAEAPGDLRMTTTVPTHGYYLKPCGYSFCKFPAPASSAQQVKLLAWEGTRSAAGPDDQGLSA